MQHAGHANIVRINELAGGTSQNVSRGYSESMEYVIEPGEFARILKTAGRQNGMEVAGVWFQASRVFRASGTNFMLERFQQ